MNAQFLHILGTALIAVLALATPASAQNFGAPPENELVAPGGAQNAAAQNNDAPAQPGAIRNMNAGTGDPCPMPENAMGAPDDLAKVQEEIDRFTLCVQRAQLLERLNESAIKNQAAGDIALGYNPAMAAGPMAGMAGPQMNAGSGMTGLAPLPANALAGADVAPKTGTPEDAAAAAITAGTAVSDDDAEPESKKTWTIGEIYGSGNEVEAKLVSPDGDEVRAHNGMKLSDGSVVVRITPSGVTLRSGSGTKSLAWATN